MTNYEIISFYGWWQFAVCLFAFVALLAVWWHIGKRQNDFGQVWLALSVLCWSISGLLEVIFTEIAPESENLREGWRSILSLFNSLFILLALPWFRYLPKPLKQIIKSRYWTYIVGLPFLFSLLPTINKMVSGRAIIVISELDVYYAFLTLGFLGYVLWESFAKRRLKALAWLSLLCILITLIAQLYKLTDSSINLPLFSAIFKTCLIMIFFALALSWVKELSESVIPIAERLKIKFISQNRSDGKRASIVSFKGFPGNTERNINLTPALFNLFLKFAERRKNTAEAWLEIKPKNAVASKREYDINDHNQIKRLLFALLDGLFGKGNWTQDHHLKPLKESLFEMSAQRERKIRLAVPSENISL
ncbi:hypothetical protein FGM00_18860 [Aggregatimonas sangjinii]|uniref:Histidine kinase N-terminal 7TM region domain-containing protein n=1 Tax=Aggregatimonas sangjinii TaxID=2583587 RepID=A0A5B7SXX9_9FLAO|nr:hypothetical protein [Aggregatimonas sangjinii]QCX02073.1 hypothetical protein FGM00_18860 [Aggregatimonas sangjinii]